MANRCGHCVSIVRQGCNYACIHFIIYRYKLEYVLFAKLNDGIHNPMFGTVIRSINELVK